MLTGYSLGGAPQAVYRQGSLAYIPSRTFTTFFSSFVAEKNQVSVQARDKDSQLACVKLKRPEAGYQQLCFTLTPSLEGMAELTIPVSTTVPLLLQAGKAISMVRDFIRSWAIHRSKATSILRQKDSFSHIYETKIHMCIASFVLSDYSPLTLPAFLLLRYSHSQDVLSRGDCSCGGYSLCLCKWHGHFQTNESEAKAQEEQEKA